MDFPHDVLLVANEMTSSSFFKIELRRETAPHRSRTGLFDFVIRRRPRPKRAWCGVESYTPCRGRRPSRQVHICSKLRDRLADRSFPWCRFITYRRTKLKSPPNGNPHNPTLK